MSYRDKFLQTRSDLGSHRQHCKDIFLRFADEMKGLVKVEFVSDVTIRVCKKDAKGIRELSPEDAISVTRGTHRGLDDFSVIFDLQIDPIQIRGLEGHRYCNSEDLEKTLEDLMTDQYFVYFMGDISNLKKVLAKPISTGNSN